MKSSSINPRPVRFLWADLEADGLDRGTSEILEIAVIGTDDQLNELFVVNEVLNPSPTAMRNLAVNEMPRAMHEKSGLMADILTGIAEGNLPAAHQVDAIIAAEITKHGSGDPVILAGSGVGHYDSHLLARQMPQTNSLLHYRPTDFGGIRQFYELTTGSSPSVANDLKTHRAIDDIRCSIEEARAYLDMYRTFLTGIAA